MAQSLIAHDGKPCREPSIPPRSRRIYSHRRRAGAQAGGHPHFPPDVRVNRLEIAKLLREEVLMPWREASRPILQVGDDSGDDAHGPAAVGVAQLPARAR